MLTHLTLLLFLLLLVGLSFALLRAMVKKGQVWAVLALLASLLGLYLAFYWPRGWDFTFWGLETTHQPQMSLALGLGALALGLGLLFQRVRFLYLENLFYRSVVEDQPELIWRSNAQGELTYVNQAFCRFFQRKPHQLLGRRIGFRLSDPLEDPIHQAQSSLRPDQPYCIYEYTLWNQEGDLCWHSRRDQAVYDENGQLLEIQSLAVDITEQKETQERMSIFHQFAERSGQAIGISKLDGVFTYVNPSLLELLHQESLPTGAKLQEWLCLAGKETKFRSILAEVQARGEWVGEMELSGLGGRRRTMQNIFVLKDNLGKPHLLGCIVIDIEGIKRTEEELERLKNALQEEVEKQTLELQKANLELELNRQELQKAVSSQRLILDNTMVGITLVRQGRFVWCSPRFVDMFYAGPKDSNLEGQRIADVVDGYLHLEAQALPVLSRGQIFSQEMLLAGKEGMAIWCNVLGKAVNPQDLSLGIIWEVEDIDDRKWTEQALTESEEKYRAVVEQSNDGIVILTEGRIVFANQRLALMSGYPVEALMGLPLEDFIPPEAASRVLALAQPEGLAQEESLASQYSRMTATSLKRNDGGSLPVEISATQFPYQNQKAIGAFFRDYSVRKRMEESLKESEEKFRRLAADSPLATISCDTQGKILYVNNAVLDMLGSPSAEATMQINMLTFPLLEQAGISQRIKHCLETGEKVVDEFPYQSKWGRSIHIRVHITPLRDEAQKVTGVLFMAEDFTAQRRAADLVQESEEKFRNLFQHSNDAILLHDLGGHILDANRKALQLFGWPRESLLGQNIDQMLAEGGPSPWEQVRNQTGITKNLFAQFESNLKNRQGQSFPADISSSLFQLRGQQVILDIIRDISRIKESEATLKLAKEQAEAASVAKAEFLATMSHEIRTPMNGVISLVRLLKETKLNQEQQEYVEALATSGDNLMTIINDILDFSKIDAGKLAIESKPFDLEACVESVLDIFGSRAAEQGIDLLYSLAPSLPSQVVGDVTRLRQVLLNLVGNAIKFTKPQGRVEIRLDGRKEEGMLRLQVEVEDTGIGIPPAALERLFDAFSQGDSSTSRKYGGTGLGLAISRRLCQLMGGDIKAQSQPGQGSCFGFHLLVEEGDNPQPPTLPVGLQGYQALLWGPCTPNLAFWQKQLGQWGIQAEAWAEGQDLQNHHLLLLDLSQGDFNPPLVESALQAGGKVVLLSFSSQAHSWPGQVQVLKKPFKHKQLLQSLTLAAGLATDQAQPAPVKKALGLDQSLGQREPLDILLAEDNQINQMLAKRILDIMGYQADVACNGVEVLERLAQKDYHLIFMDVQMPELDGLQTTKCILKERTRSHSPVIIAMTANVMQGDREKCLDAGMDDYLGKPILPEQVQAAIEHWAQEARKRIQRYQSPQKAMRQSPLIDHQLIESRKALDIEFILILIETFLKDALDLNQEVQRLFGQPDLMEAGKAAHKFKGVAANVGAKALAEVCFELEQKGKQQTSEGLPALLQELEEMTTQTIQAYHKLKVSLGG